MVVIIKWVALPLVLIVCALFVFGCGTLDASRATITNSDRITKSLISMLRDTGISQGARLKIINYLHCEGVAESLSDDILRKNLRASVVILHSYRPPGGSPRMRGMRVEGGSSEIEEVRTVKITLGDICKSLLVHSKADEHGEYIGKRGYGGMIIKLNK